MFVINDNRSHGEVFFISVSIFKSELKKAISWKEGNTEEIIAKITMDCFVRYVVSFMINKERKCQAGHNLQKVC